MIDQMLEIRVQVQPLNRRLEGGQEADGETDAAGGLQNINPAAQSLDCAGEIKGTALKKFRPMPGAYRLTRPFQKKLRRDRFGHGPQTAPHPQNRIQTGFQMQVTGPLLLGHGDEFQQVHKNAGKAKETAKIARKSAHNFFMLISTPKTPPGCGAILISSIDPSGWQERTQMSI